MCNNEMNWIHDETEAEIDEIEEIIDTLLHDWDFD